MTMVRRAVLALLMLMIAGLGLLALGYRNARADPVVRRIAVALPGWPAGARPVTVALLGDIHIGSATMDAARLDRIVAQVNAQRPDLIVMVGDFIVGHEPGSAARLAPALVAPLSRLRAPLGVVAVPGNHDHWTGVAAVTTALDQAGVLVLRNGAAARGPLAIAGLDDRPTRHARLATTLAAIEALDGAGVMIAHSPILGGRPSARIRLVLAGHTHCGQVVLPIIGAPRQVTNPHYRCGVVRDPARLTVVTAGLGTSVLPVRFGAPPDFWLVRLGGIRAAL
ncbi:metallophosphoesterase [Sphingomonas sp. 1P08PE]|uniref:metallophosphoesterase n=1 Tax=Sphingomonas sp. 1P08PE TaxID=554122 RepID=UPI0039A332DB